MAVPDEVINYFGKSENTKSGERKNREDKIYQHGTQNRKYKNDPTKSETSGDYDAVFLTYLID